MKGLMRKELCLLRTGTGLLFFVATTLFAISGGLAHESGMLQGFAFIYVLLGTYNIMSMEEKWRWNTYILCAPVTRFQTVLAKYIITLGQMALNAVIYTTVNLLAYDGTGLTNMLLQIAVALIMGAVLFPLLFRFGAEKAWIAAIFLVVILGGMGMGAAAAILEDMNLAGLLGQSGFAWLLLLAGLALFGLSCPLSAKLYAKRK